MKQHFLSIAALTALISTPVAHGAASPKEYPKYKYGGYLVGSIQDVIDTKNLPEITAGEINLSLSKNFLINDLKGLTNVPNIQKATTIKLNGYPEKIIRPGTFDGLSNVQTLFLMNTRIKTQPDMFIGLVNLQTLILANANITDIQPGTFKGLPNLKTLNLSFNTITTLEPGAFADLTNLRNLYLDNNQITKIQSGAFAGLTNLENLWLYANPIANNPAEHDRINAEVRAIAPKAKIIWQQY